MPNLVVIADPNGAGKSTAAALRESGRDAWRRHKALGLPVVIWRDGKVVVVPPEEIEI